MRKVTVLGAIFLLMAFKAEEPKTYKFEFTAEETQVIYDALGELPAKKAEVIRFKLVQQVNAANQQQQQQKEKK